MEVVIKKSLMCERVNVPEQVKSTVCDLEKWYAEVKDSWVDEEGRLDDLPLPPERPINPKKRTKVDQEARTEFLKPIVKNYSHSQLKKVINNFLFKNFDRSQLSRENEKNIFKTYFFFKIFHHF